MFYVSISISIYLSLYWREECVWYSEGVARRGEERLERYRLGGLCGWFEAVTSDLLTKEPVLSLNTFSFA